MSFVLDASTALAWVFEDERTDASEALLDRMVVEGATVPGIWRLEVANALRSAIRRQRITADYRDAALAQLAALAITTDAETDAHAWGATTALSTRADITLYDAAYLELAFRKGMALATADAALRAAATSLGVELAA